MSPKPPSVKKPGKKPGQGRSAPSKKSGRGKKNPVDWRLHLLLFGAALLVIGLVWLARREERLPVPPPDRPEQTRVDPAAAAREQVEAFLAAAAMPAAAITREPPDQPRRYQVRHRLPAAPALDQLRQRLRRLTPPLVLSIPEDGVLAITDGQGQALVSIHFLPPAPPPVAPAPGMRGKVAIIMDDLGRGTHTAKQLLAIRQPVTLAILPGEPHATQVAALAHAAGREIILHAPMEPQGFPVIDPGDDALLVGQADAELRAHLDTLLRRVPHTVGVNNHMGSRFTEDQRAMATVMAVLRERGLFFVDSLTTSRSLGAATARSAGVPLIRRDIFLDNVAEVEAIAQQLSRLAAMARRNGSAVGICHPYPETLQALRRELPKLAAEGIEFVPVSRLVKGGG
jgi:polysaccharide deacetylase 2 family uncharacterized protein YibQ